MQRITLQEFERLIKVAETFFYFIEEIKREHNINWPNETYGIGRVWTTNGIEEYAKLSAAVFIDIANCYKWTGHPLDVQAQEGIGLFLIDYMLPSRGAKQRSLKNIDGEEVDIFALDEESMEKLQFDTSHTVLLFQEFEKLGLSEELFEKRELLLYNILGKVDPELAKRYALRLFRFLEVISKVDKYLSFEESQWISAIKPFENLK